MRLITITAAVSALALASACGSESPASTEATLESPPETQQEAALEVDVLDCGTIEVSDLDAFSSAGDYAGETDTFTDSCFLVRHPDGNLLWDLGLPGVLAIAGPQTQQIFTVSLEQTITEQLADRGMSPDDVDYVSISHSHFDHIGQADQVAGSTWLVSQKELDAMFGEGAEIAQEQQALFSLFAPMEQKVFEDELDVFGDGSVVIFETPGHTPGHTSLQLMMPETGPVLLTGDLYHRAESRELKRVPRFNSDEAMTVSSMEAFEARADALGAKVIIQHEPADIDPLEGKIR
ncbi:MULTISPECIES: N-acyl homoserine lactonase family protein [unclassified Hyphomonas]|jgi:glyoxylase-like metal-dependent hydrolase (beta-lactamase superfamily II)|uniref:N-acyl homoserine lactonase family protein n=1 Tax=unclassified Hyphomonas TaxID=2630699 RepID=UPI000C352678|nr:MULTISPECIES: N-acyl homoserine lactonase family protein [unclassified Hyphomonas]MAL43904.1 N-acyl homoserine lactonase family protein [Hyphomonas sp.]MAX84294.1 N-acyl homoserine lactonase family protein [Hyphomonas sp.]MBG67545.1 N-acyl homoserine lactonase family protein [Hyphomonas sp.]MBO6583898.1 N-acyl homoserine lactonase family protein [Hyphomonas sp.]QSR20841.1 N-acyl homoserine lactonase family protein [Hyphomonas sp. KY3]|tara:strand:+ start:871 stop:1746 length:876 start_codon:yes stop_codon:yes gene_type:complete